MPTIKLTGKPMQDRITDRLKSSGEGAKPDLMVKKGDGPFENDNSPSSFRNQRNERDEEREQINGRR